MDEADTGDTKALTTSSRLPRSPSPAAAQDQQQDHQHPQSLTYAQSGVSITSGSDLVTRIRPLLKTTARPGSTAQIGGFGGLFSLPLASYPSTSPTLVLAIDGVGTKLLLAQRLGIFDTVGVDLVAMNVNDLVVQGAEPLAFLDYYACGKLDVGSAESFVRGVVRGCRDAGCALVGGETAEMPGLYHGQDFDAAGCAVGALRVGVRALPVVEEMKKGDVLVGLGASGVHSNGFSLVRKIVERSGLGWEGQAPWEGKGRSVGQALLEPTRIYVKSLLRVLQRDIENENTEPSDSSPPSTTSTTTSTGTSTGTINTTTTTKRRIKGIAHITGGGLVENIPRMLPQHLAARIDVTSWRWQEDTNSPPSSASESFSSASKSSSPSSSSSSPLPPVFKWLKQTGHIEAAEMARTFNCGLGMVLVVDEGCVEEVMGELRGAGERCWRVGGLVPRRGVGEEGGGCVLEGLERW